MNVYVSEVTFTDVRIIAVFDNSFEAIQYAKMYCASMKPAENASEKDCGYIEVVKMPDVDDPETWIYMYQSDYYLMEY